MDDYQVRGRFAMCEQRLTNVEELAGRIIRLEHRLSAMDIVLDDVVSSLNSVSRSLAMLQGMVIAEERTVEHGTK